MKKRIGSLALCAGLLASMLSLSACGLPEAREQDKFDGYMESLPARLLDASNMNLNYLFANKATYGFKDALYVLPYADKDDYDRDNKESAALLDELQAFEPERLREDQRLDRAILMDYITRSQKLQQYYYLGNSYLGSFIGFQAQLPILLNEYMFHSKSDLDSYFHILETAPETFLKYAEIEKERQAHGTGMPQLVIDKVMGQCDNFVKEERPFLIDTIGGKIDQLDFLNAQEKADAKAWNEKLLTGAFIDAYKGLKEALSSIKGSDSALGLASQPDGKAYYEALVQAQSGVDDTIPDIQKFLKERVEALSEQLRQLVSQHPEAVLKEVPAYGTFTTAEQTLDYLREKTAADYPALPALRYEVKQVPAALKDNFSPAAYLQGRFGASADTPEQIYLNGDYTPALFSTIAHEGYPGHMYQHAYFRSTSPAAVRTMVDYSGYSEGWATYVEWNSWKYADTDADGRIRLQMEQISQELVALYIALSDIGIHYEGWDRAAFKQALESLVGEGALNEDALKEQYDLILETPGNYIQYYYTGQLFQVMYDQTKEAMGDAFDPVEFHRVLLETGPAPQKILQQQVDAYKETAKADAA